MKINIKGPIIPNSNQWIYDWFGIEAVSPKRISEFISNANNEDLEVEINSNGGSVFDASEIYTALKDYPGNVTVKIVGIAASAASVISMAGNKIMMSPTAQMMIHNASTISQGDYRDMDHTSGFLKNVNQTIANAYSLKSGKSYEELLAMMDAETWLTPQQALEQNLIDEIMFDQGIQAVASADEFMIPQKVIDKIRNELTSQGPKNQMNNAQVVNQVEANLKEDETMTSEELKNKFPELYAQIKNEGYTEGVQAENDRIKEIEDLGAVGDADLVNKAKFETKATAEQLAVEIIKAQKQNGINYLQNRNQEAKELDKVEGSDAPDNTKSEDSERKEAASVIANFINKKRGGTK